MSPPQRMRASGAAVAAGHVVLGAIATFALGVPGAEWFFGLCALATLTLSLAAAPLLRPSGGGGDDGPGEPPDEPPPPWWPEFEREFRAYVERRSRVPTA
jgi:hypothetical protein